MQHMKNSAFANLLAIVIFFGVPSAALAGPATDALSTCLADNTTGRDRKDLVRWMFAGMSTHPEIKALSVVTQDTRDQLDRLAASLLERLLTENCKTQTREAMRVDGNTSIRASFEIVGRLAMQELMSNPEVNASFMRFSQFLNKEKFDEIMK